MGPVFLYLFPSSIASIPPLSSLPSSRALKSLASSQPAIMSEKDRAKRGFWPWKRHRLYHGLFACLLGFIFIVLLTIFIIWLVLRPSRPHFDLEDSSINAFNLSDSNLLTTIMQVTVSSRNPNSRVGIYYDKLDVFTTYKGQQITVATQLPPNYLGHHDIVVWSPFLSGNSVPLAPSLSYELMENLNAGLLLLYVKVEGKLRWKVGSWTSGHYHIHVKCPAFFSVDSGFMFRFERLRPCSVDV